MLERGKDLKR